MKVNINHTLDEINRLFQKEGEQPYFGEEVTQYQHAGQAALLAIEKGLKPSVQIAAFLHDIGHLMPITNPADKMDVYGHQFHEKVAGDWMRENGFGEEVARLVESHVLAKRYLCSKNTDYFHGLSDASKATFWLQGGPMLPNEIELFEELPFFQEIIQLRILDDEAKDPEVLVPPISYFLSLCQSYLHSLSI